jgi:hypothetical protein
MQLIESMNDALIECVKACGGSKQAGARLWPELAPDQAQRKMLDCLNPDRPQRLTPEQVLLVLKMARDRGNHIGIEYIADALGYTKPHPIEPEDERAILQREFVQGVGALTKLVERIEKVGAPLKAVA